MKDKAKVNQNFEDTKYKIERIKLGIEIILEQVPGTEFATCFNVDYQTLELLSTHYNEHISRSNLDPHGDLRAIIIQHKGNFIHIREHSFAEMIEHKIKSENPT